MPRFCPGPGSQLPGGNLGWRCPLEAQGDQGGGLGLCRHVRGLGSGGPCPVAAEELLPPGPGPAPLLWGRSSSWPEGLVGASWPRTAGQGSGHPPSSAHTVGSRSAHSRRDWGCIASALQSQPADPQARGGGQAGGRALEAAPCPLTPRPPPVQAGASARSPRASSRCSARARHWQPVASRS